MAPEWPAGWLPVALSARHAPSRLHLSTPPPSSTCPLLLLTWQVVYNDVLLPLCDTVVVLKDAWNYVDEKVAGIVTQIIVTGIQHYDLCSKNNHLKECLLVLHQVREASTDLS